MKQIDKLLSKGRYYLTLENLLLQESFENQKQILGEFCLSDIHQIKEALLQFEQELDDKRFEEINENIELLFKAIQEAEIHAQ